MKLEKFTEILTEITEWVLDTEEVKKIHGKRLDENGKYCHTPAEGGLYPVVLQYKTRTTICDWCLESTECPNKKIFQKQFQSSPVWNAKCQTCGQKRIINPKE